MLLFCYAFTVLCAFFTCPRRVGGGGWGNGSLVRALLLRFYQDYTRLIVVSFMWASALGDLEPLTAQNIAKLHKNLWKPDRRHNPEPWTLHSKVVIQGICRFRVCRGGCVQKGVFK